MPQQPLMMIVLINVLGVAGILLWHLQGRSRPTARLIAQIVFFLAMSVAVALAGMDPLRFEAPQFDGLGGLVVAAKILWWTHLSWATIGFVRICIVLEGQPREARLLQDLVVAVVYLGVLLSIMAFVFGVRVGTLLATSGVIAIILGLALQNTLGDVFSGIALTLGRPYAIGDWVQLGDGTEGRVVASNWRSTYLLTAAHNQMVLPNSVLAKQVLTNVSKPDENHQLMLSLRIVPTGRPRFVIDVMHDVLASCNSIVHDPPPSVVLVGIGATAIEVELYFQVKGPSRRGAARNEVIDLVYRHCASNSLVLAMPVGTSQIPDSLISIPHTSLEESIGSSSFFIGLDEDGCRALVTLVIERQFAAGETILERGAAGDALMLVKSGVAAVNHDGQQGVRLAPGDWFGAIDVTTEALEQSEITAVTATKIFTIERASLDALMAERPELATIVLRNLASSEAARAAQIDRPALKSDSRHDLAYAIRTIFRNK